MKYKVTIYQIEPPVKKKKAKKKAKKAGKKAAPKPDTHQVPISDLSL